MRDNPPVAARQTTNHSSRINLLARNLATTSRVSRILHTPKNQKHNPSARKTPTPPGVKLLVAPGFNPGYASTIILRAPNDKSFVPHPTFWRATLQLPSGKPNRCTPQNQKHNPSSQKTPTPPGVKLSVAPGFNPGYASTIILRAKREIIRAASNLLARNLAHLLG